MSNFYDNDVDNSLMGWRVHAAGKHQEALEYFEPLAQKGYNMEVQFKVAMIYYAGGENIPKDYVQARKWLILAITNDVSLFSYSLKAKEIDEARKQLAKISSEMTPEQIAESEKLASAWKPNVK